MSTENVASSDVVTQVGIGGFDSNVTAKDLVRYLEKKIGLVWRCRLKTSWTPPESYPQFDITDAEDIVIDDSYSRVEPHAFVHFASTRSRDLALDAANSSSLVLGDKQLIVSFGPENPYSLNQRRRTTIPFKLPDVCIEIGNMVRDDMLFVGWRGPPSGVEFIVDPFDGTCKFRFSKETVFSFKDTGAHAIIKCDFKVEFLVREIKKVKLYNEMCCKVILFHLDSAPWVWYRTADDVIETTVPFDLLDDDDPWIRTTDFTPSGAVGRCNFYRISVPPRHGAELERAMKYLRERRVHMEFCGRSIRIMDEPDFGKPQKCDFFSIKGCQGISFDLMFMLNAAIHKGIINQHQLSEDIYDFLRKQSEQLSLAILQNICGYRNCVFNLNWKLRSVKHWLLKNPVESVRKMDDMMEIRRLIITPTRAFCFPPDVELSNRVVRKYKHKADRFLRVTFMDEGMQAMNANVLNYYVAHIVRQITGYSFPQKTKVFKRVRDILTNGFHVCGRKYSFLAFSSNQLRDRSAWFIAEDDEITVLKVKSWMGKFTEKNIAKCAARIGQCFSSTYATVDVPQEEVDLDYPDIQRNNYTFSDGIGMIAPELAIEVAKKLKLDMSPPCAYQIRYAGCKGVVASWPKRLPDGYRLCMRRSMKKFISTHSVLEICSWTRFQPGFLNRQIIKLLTALKVPDQTFWTMQESMLSRLNKMLVDLEVAFDILVESCAEQGNIAAIMLSAGFNPLTEPHLRGMLNCIRASQLWDLREKSRIFIDKGRWLMGCFDELGVLEEGQCFIQISSQCIENCFANHGLSFNGVKKQLNVIRGTVAIAKNPCLHPGDIRILEAVDAPGLHHMYDCLIFPQKGERPHTNEASGSDLDGDLYFVTWDENLIPPDKKSWPPMQYDAAEAQTLRRDVNHQDIIEFFVKNMVNESLGAICNAHVVLSDIKENGALDDDCITLAELAATAVDFPKTGKIVHLPQTLRPKVYPDFMGKDETISYRSEKILGRLHRKIKEVYDNDLLTSADHKLGLDEIQYDKDLEVLGSDEYLVDAWDKKRSYDKQLKGLLAQYRVKREEEIVTGHIWSMPKYTSRKLGDLKEKIRHAYTAMKKEFRLIFEDLNMELGLLSDEDTNMHYERKASAWYQVTYHPDYVKMSIKSLGDDDADNNTAMLSFTWIAADYLARIKLRNKSPEAVDTSKPVYSLMKYIADRA